MASSAAKKEKKQLEKEVASLVDNEVTADNENDIDEEVPEEDDDDEEYDEDEMDEETLRRYRLYIKRKRAAERLLKQSQNGNGGVLSVVYLLSTLLSAILLTGTIIWLRHSKVSNPLASIIHNHNNNHNKKVSYSCPSHVPKSSNDKNSSFTFYSTNIQSFKSTHTTSELMNMPYDAWNITPQQHMDLCRRWIHWYGDNLQSGNSIYESACGVGMTMYVTLKLLSEIYGITNLNVYGSDYSRDSIAIINRLYDQYNTNHNDLIANTAPAADAGNTTNTANGTKTSGSGVVQVHKQQFCHADSTNLSFVPASSFDLVFTGYIDPIIDPLNLGLAESDYYKYCHSQKEKKQLLVQKDQKAQEDWYARWVQQMIRLVKPGGVIIIEANGIPKCDDATGWGGVSKSWWKQAVKIYDWDVDESSMEIMGYGSKLGSSEERYNVFIRRNADTN